LADLIDAALPAQQRRGLRRGVLAAVIDGIKPVPEPLVPFFERQQRLRIERGENLLAHRTKEAFDLAAAFGLIRLRVNDQDTEGGGNARQLRGAVDP